MDMACYQTDYQSLSSVNEDADTPPDNVIFHVHPEKSRWNHIEDLDSFFRKISFLQHFLILKYHQKHGFVCIVASQLCGLGQFVFISLFLVYVINCVDYDAVTRHVSYKNTTYVGKLKLTDLPIPVGVCVKRLGLFTWICLIIAIIFFISSLCRTIYCLLNFYEIKLFYNNALKIPNHELDNTTWHEVQCKLREVQQEQQMCIHKQDLSELDIYHRILRHENYMVAMMNKNILPLKYKLPLFGEIVYFSSGLRYNIEFLLFRSPFSPFKSTWQLKDDYKKFNKRNEIAEKLSNAFLLLGIANLLLSPFIFLWQLLSFCVNYAGHIRREPGFFGLRKWSQYSRLYLRHFNELDHELQARLNRAYNPSKAFINSFSSHILIIFARNIAGIAGTIGLYFILWTTFFQNEVIETEFLLTALTCVTLLGSAVLSFVPDEHLVFIPKLLMDQILADIHYIPDAWKKKEHTQLVRNEFSQLFQLTLSYILEQLISPAITPLILMFRLRRRSLDIVDFFRSFTVEVAGVGDVCSFALMDISRHGNYQWIGENHTNTDQFQQAENGKTELSLVHFTMTNPHWQPSPSSNLFMNNLRDHAHREANTLAEASNCNALSTSLNSLEAFGKTHQSYVRNVRRAYWQRDATYDSMLLSQREENSYIQRPVMSGGGVSLSEGPLHGQTGILSSLQANSPGEETLQHQLQELNPLQYRAAEMSLSAMYLHELHYKRLQILRHTLSTQMHAMPPQEGVQEPEEDEEITGSPTKPPHGAIQ